MKPSLLVGLSLLLTATRSVTTYCFADEPAPLSAVKSFITSVETTDLEDAYLGLHSEFKLRHPYHEFETTWEGRSAFLSKANRNWCTSIENESAEVRGRFSTTDSEDWAVVFQLITQGGVWKIFDYKIPIESSTK